MAAFFAIFVLVFLHYNAEGLPEVNITQGRVRGYYTTSYEGRNFSAFEGIPYAKPPVGDLRFEPPQEADSWTGVLNAVTEYMCPQLQQLGDENSIGQEDCLYINVYTPRLQPSPDDKLDVLVAIHGGGFLMGSAASLVKPIFFMDLDIILVTFNYRLGVLGFLSTEDEVVPGNSGLKDQIMALQWVQKNIKNFGGNPDSVTIDGTSAGAGSVHYHYVSPLSKGLFHRGFSHSGTVLNPWAVGKAPLAYTQKLGAAVGCVYDNSTRDLVRCLKEQPAGKLVEKVGVIYEMSLFPIVPFGPVIESRTEGAFVPEHPYKLLANGEINDVPWINSHTAEDGTIPGALLLQQVDTLNNNWDNVGKFVLDCNYTLSDADKYETLKKVREFYFGNESITIANIDKLIKLGTDRYFKLAAIKSSQMQSKVAKSPVYFLTYAYKGSNSVAEALVPGLDLDLGVAHGDDMLYLYGTLYNNTLSATDKQIKDVWLGIFQSYIQTGVPKIQGADWTPVSNSSSELTYLELLSPNSTNIKTDSHYLEAMQFWDSLPLKENQNLF